MRSYFWDILVTILKGVWMGLYNIFIYERRSHFGHSMKNTENEIFFSFPTFFPHQKKIKS